MKIAAVPETILEWLIARAGRAPTPIVETFHAAILARAVMVATRLEVFEALAGGPLTAAQAARRLGVDARATEKLLNVLAAARYLKYRRGRYGLTRSTRRWLLRDSPWSVRDNMLLRFLEWQAVERLEDFVRTGKPLDVHDMIEGDQWAVYQRGMRALARLTAGEVVRRVPAPRRARAMLDIGGGHGAFAAAFCRRHPRLRATILDLPAAVEAAAPLLAEEALGERVIHRAGDALAADLGEADWDLIFLSHVVHHFSAAASAALIARAGRALRPGGTLAVLEAPRSETPAAGGQTGTLLDLYFAITSNAGTWSEAEIARWLGEAGLRPHRTIALRTAPGLAIICAAKPAG